ncbi:serine/threonine-protein kinase [Gemmata sp. JC717]|uniref:serine/threonine-protein kinase n=1 Tax=Gemmata algarum TaxID=2975278 RepID=UPI0021BBB0E1|nr:serine/threonine-protein kinase [Gemmata algarum]MDY3555917.1 serine/threonine-protein kinase [Gemmata algarum]
MVGKTALGKYRLLRSLGAGSNAEVFLAQPLNSPDHRAVVKRVHDHVVTHPKFRQLFEAEVRSMANFHHPYAVQLIEASLDDPIGPCLVMEYVPGITLEELIQRERVLTPERAGRLLGGFCHALQAAHDAGIVHRDLKPSNLMVLNAGRADESLKVMDFGFAGFSAKPHIQLAELTGHGAIYAIGTPAYVSPEMIRGDRVDGRSDLYSVGIILYELLTGRLPFNYHTQDKLLTAHIKDAPPRFHKIGCSHLPPPLEAVVQLALSKYPNERQQSAQELASMFGQATGEDIWAATLPEGWEPLAAEEEADAVVAPPARVRPSPADPFHVLHEFEALMPERMAAAKLRGFVEDFGGQVLASEPGVIKLRLGVPEGYKEAKERSGILGWFAGRRPTVPRGHEPIELELQMDKPDPGQPRLCVVAAFRPMKEYPPQDQRNWHDRCDKLHHALRQYLGM